MRIARTLSFAIANLSELAIDVDGKVVNAKTRASVIRAPHGFATLGSYTLNFSSNFTSEFLKANATNHGRLRLRLIWRWR